MVFCSSCGKENPEGAKFCNGCGFQIEETTVKEQVTVAKTSPQIYASPGYPQQTANAQWPMQRSPQQDPHVPQPNEPRNATESNAATIRCTRCGATNAFDAKLCEKCGWIIIHYLPDTHQSPPQQTYGPQSSSTFPPGTPFWAKGAGIILVFLMIGSALVLLIGGFAYTTGLKLLGFFDYVIFGGIFLITYGIYKFADRLPRSVRKSIKSNFKDFKFSENITSPNMQNPQNRPPQTAIGFQYCSACGAALEQGAIFCGSCGSANR
jgi:ribosomal protein L40E